MYLGEKGAEGVVRSGGRRNWMECIVGHVSRMCETLGLICSTTEKGVKDCKNGKWVYGSSLGQKRWTDGRLDWISER